MNKDWDDDREPCHEGKKMDWSSIGELKVNVKRVLYAEYVPSANGQIERLTKDVKLPDGDA